MRERIQLAPNSKVPAVKGGWKTSTDVQEVSSWIGDGYNVGLVTEKVTAVDWDVKELARDFYRKYKDRITVGWETARGAHFLFEGETATRKFEHYDLKSGPHAYVVCPPSEVKGFLYNLFLGNIDETELKQLPEDYVPNQEHYDVQPIEAATNIERIRRAAKWIERRIEKGEIAISGQGGHKQFFKVTCGLFQFFGLSIHDALPLIVFYNSKCMPPFDDKSVLHKLNDAYAKSHCAL